ncbi:ABC transporter permease [Streptococcus oriscaviae]|uniref:ABC transporter permease n=1 Tax=Streptococcus oriscaviae TaxID=2781599 RepID=A0ABX7YJC6_9STRE|nr:ABC transporter permease [Streptococcus oriscaviae]QUE53911.1 ABC transporter permease [Streptococcus oriscaviae]HEL1008727.1 ABC transporter permease [Streptococcus equi subsp. zooepidemicus]
MEEIKTALQSILSHKMRSILTMLGIIIGIAAIIAIFSIIEGNTETTKRQLIGGSNNTMDVVYAKKSALDARIASKDNAKKPLYLPFIGQEEVPAIKKLAGVKDVALTYETDDTIYYLEKQSSSKIVATTPNIRDLKQLAIVKGKGFEQASFKEEEQVTILERSLYEQLFPNDDGIGKYVDIKSIPFKVIGAYQSQDSANVYGGGKTAYIPLGQWHHVTEEINVAPTTVVQTVKTDDLKPVSQAVGNYLNQKVADSDYAFGTMNLSDFERQIENLNQSNFVLLAGIASISLLVGGIGVMNIMLVSVTERTREIGIKKALGARRNIILRQFLIEAVILTLIGGFIGVFTGIVSGFIITQSLAYPYILSLLSVLVSLLFCCIIGIVFGLLPAIKASKLNPIEALRFE